MIRATVVTAIALVLAFAHSSAQERQTPVPEPERPARPARPGVSTPGVKRDITAITPLAVFPVEGTPDWQVVTSDAVWVTSARTNRVHRLDPKTNKVAAVIEVGKRPCSGLASGFGSIWVPNCGDSTLSRIDVKTNSVTTTLPFGAAASEGGIAATADSIWMLTDPHGALSRIDPDTNSIVADIPIPSGSFVCVVADDGSVWAVSTEKSVIVRVDPKTNLVTDRVEVGPQPRFTTVGAGSIWTLNQGDGTVSRVDTRTKKRVATIDLGIPGTGGEIAFGEGFVWVTIMEVPLTQIDPNTNKVLKQWFGAGGDAVRVGHGSIWLSNLRQGNVWRIDPRQP